MARTELTKTVTPGGYSGTGNKLTMAAADTSNNNYFSANGNDLVAAHNTSVDTNYTVTITSVDDRFGRTEDISTYSVPHGEIHILGPFPTHGWQQSDGSIYLQASNSAVKFGIINLGG